MRDRRTKNIHKIIISQLAVGLLMVAVGIVVTFIAQGYRFNFNNFKVIKTGMVFLAGNQKSVDVYINSEFVSNKLPYSKALTPGYYDVRVEKNGYSSWQANVKIEPELVSDFRSIVMFRDQPVSEELKEESKISLLYTPIDVLAVNAEKKLYHNDYEIWIDDTLVARFSKPVIRAMWYPDLEHIVYQQGKQIRVMEKTGLNDTLLVELSSDSPTVFTIGNKGQELYYADNGEYYWTNIK